MSSSSVMLTECDTVAQQIYLHWRKLVEIHVLVQDIKDTDQPLISTTEDIQSHSQLDIESENFPFLHFEQAIPSEELLPRAQNARKWLLQIINYQAHLDRAYFVRLFRFILESESLNWTDLQRLYFALTKDSIGDATQRLRVAFSLCLHGNFAEIYKLELERLQQQIHLKSLPHSTHLTPSILAARNKIAAKIDSSKVTIFACAVPLHPDIISAPESERTCPICRESYLDFNNNLASDLLVDYPVRIKYCGHVLGKSCLEMWMSTPNKDLAKYPHKTCPFCRTQIEDREDEPDLSQEIISRIENSRFVKQIMQAMEMEVMDVVDAIKRCMGEEIAIKELQSELAKQKKVGIVDGKKAEAAEKVLMKARKEGLLERAVWMIPDELWERARETWVEEMV